jgi:hypothetical protein
MTKKRWEVIKGTLTDCVGFDYDLSGVTPDLCAEIEKALKFEEASEGPKYTSEFELFWNLYPRHVGKGAAFKVWNRLHPSVYLQNRILIAIDRQKRSDQWQRENGRFIPHAATWLNGARFDDDEGTSAVPPKLQVVL